MKRITAINRAIKKAIKKVAAKTKVSLQEPDYNAAIALEFPSFLNSCGAFPTVKFGGCYIHQSPIASVPAPKKYSCEVGDLLAICHQVVDGDDRYNAVLVQWKKPKKAFPENIAGNALNQLDLYEHWPSFSLSGTKKVYDIYPKTVTPGAQYGLISDSTKDVRLFCTIPVKQLSIIDTPTFSRFLIDFMRWQTGRPFQLDPPPGNDDWSHLINELIHASLIKGYTRRRIGAIGEPRASSKDLLSMMVISDQSDNVGNTAGETSADAISILFIDMGSKQE